MVNRGLPLIAPERQWAYWELFRTHIGTERIAEIRKATNGNYAFGNDRFKKEIEQMLARRATPGRSGRLAKYKEIVDG